MDHTIDINTYRDQLLNDIRALDNLEALESIRRAYIRAVRKLKQEASSLPPYTLEELNARVEKAETEFAAGQGIASEEAHRQMRQSFPA